MLTIHQLIAKLNVSKTSIYEWIKTSGFPAPYKFGKASRWKESEVDQWAENCKEAA